MSRIRSHYSTEFFLEPKAACGGNIFQGSDINMRSQRLNLAICLFLTVATLSTFWQGRNHEFVVYDDLLYVVENSHVQAGLTWKGITWAFTTNHASNWHPLTWLSHMLDCHIYGLNPGGHHFTNILLHVLNGLMVFLVLRQMSRGLWQSAFVAALFALHPLHVESVAWVSERKDVLSTFFWMLTMWSYVRYVQRPSPARYVLVLSAFAFGLMSKPMLVTLPFVLLLIDYWPLGRFQMGLSNDADVRKKDKPDTLSREKSPFLHLVWEKTPLFVLAILSSIITIVAQNQGGAVKSLEVFPLMTRVANALVSYLGYIGKMIWPHGLAVLYPHPGNSLSLWQPVGAGLFLLGISFGAIRVARTCPYIPVGLLWYVGTLVPVIGLVQIGNQSMADRYTYVPLIGLFIIIAWGAADLLSRWHYQTILVAVCIGVLLPALMICSRIQVRHWRDSTSLLEHALEVTTDNYIAHNNLGAVLAAKGKFQEAISHYSQAIRVKPGYADAHNNLGNALAAEGKLQEAISHYSRAIRANPNHAKAHYNVGLALAKQGKLDTAIGHFSEAIRIKPNLAEASNILRSLRQVRKLGTVSNTPTGK